MSFQSKVDEWVLACFGQAVRDSQIERGHRFLEESIELAQAAGVTKAECLQLIDYVFNRPTGTVQQEVGGTLITLAALCATFNVDMDNEGNAELARIWGKIDLIRAKHATKPKSSPLPGTSPTTDPADDVCSRCGQTSGLGGCDGFCDVPGL